MTFQQEYLQTPPPPRGDSELTRLAEQYHERTEAYDRTVCTGNDFDSVGGIIPAGPEEQQLIQRHAHGVFEELAKAAARRGITRTELRRAISRTRPLPV